MQDIDKQYVFRPLNIEDEPFLWEMVYQGIYVNEGQVPPSRELLLKPELSCYVQGWGAKDDSGFLVSNAKDQPVGALWLRKLQASNRGYGYVDDDTLELSIAILPEYRGQGLGTQLLNNLFSSPIGCCDISLSVSMDNPVRHLYKKFGFVLVHKQGSSMTMKRNGAAYRSELFK